MASNSPAPLPVRDRASASARTRICGFVRNADGGAAVEFGMVALPFFGLLGAIIQFGFILWAGQNIDHRLQKAVRGLLTGAFQNSNAGVTDQATILKNLKTAMCQSSGKTIVTVFTCADIRLNVSIATSFSGGKGASPINASTKAWDPKFESYTCAKPGDIVVVTAAVALPTFFTILNPNVSGMADGSYLLQSTAVFRTEPYQTVTSTGC